MAASMACAQDKENAVENIGDAVRNFADEVVFSLKNSGAPTGGLLSKKGKPERMDVASIDFKPEAWVEGIISREHSFDAGAPVTPSSKAKGMPVQHRSSLFSSPFGCLKARAAPGGCCNGQASPAILRMYKDPMATPEDWKLRRVVRREVRRQAKQPQSKRSKGYVPALIKALAHSSVPASSIRSVDDVSFQDTDHTICLSLGSSSPDSTAVSTPRQLAWSTKKVRGGIRFDYEEEEEGEPSASAFDDSFISPSKLEVLVKDAAAVVIQRFLSNAMRGIRAGRLAEQAKVATSIRRTASARASKQVYEAPQDAAAPPQSSSSSAAAAAAAVSSSRARPDERHSGDGRIDGEEASVEAGSEPQAEDLAGNEEEEEEKEKEEEEKEEGGDDGVRGGEEGSGKLEEAISKWRLVSSTAEKEGSEQPSRLARVHQMSGGKAVVEATGSEPQVTARPRFERVYKGPPSLAAAHATVGVNQMSRRRKVPEAKRSIVSRAMRRMMKRLT